jgi:8-oxo-dGTP pyrophosphatase MutT (NUDIX family)
MKNKTTKEAILNVAQKAFIEKDEKVLVVWNKHGIDFPGGRINEDEVKNGEPKNLAESLRREVSEETGLEIKILNPFATWFGLRGRSKTFVVGYICKWVAGEVKLSDEHHKYEWVSGSDFMKFSEDGEYFEALNKYFKINEPKGNNQ